MVTNKVDINQQKVDSSPVQEYMVPPAGDESSSSGWRCNQLSADGILVPAR
jgi:hypothetical protein